MNSIAVIGGTSSSFQDDDIANSAKVLGDMLALGNSPVLTCGVGCGVIGILLDALRDSAISKLSVVLRDGEERHLHVSAGSTIFVNSIAERKAIFLEQARGIIALPGGLGTHDEIISFLMLLRGTSKKIALVNAGGYFDPLVEQLSNMIRAGFLKEDALRSISVHWEAADALAAVLDSSDIAP